MSKPCSRVLMLTEYFMPFDRGGSEWSVYHLAKQLLEKRHAVLVFTPNYGSIRHESRDGIDIYRFPFVKKLTSQSQVVTPYYFTNMLWQISSLVFLMYIILIFRPTHLHVQGKYFLPAAIIIGKIFRIPVVTTLRDYIVLCPFAYCINKRNKWKACSLTQILQRDMPRPVTIIKFVSALRGWLVSQILKYTLNKSQKIIGISHKLADIYKRNGVEVDKVIYNSVLRIRKNIKNKGYLLFVGRLTKGKGVDMLVSAYCQLPAIKKPELYIIGAGPLENKLRGELEGIRFLGRKSYKETQKYLSCAMAAIVPSYWEEPFGRVALEALSCGVPVLATNKGALAEIVENEVTGFIVEPTQAEIKRGLIKIIRTGRFLRENIRQKRSQLAKKFVNDPAEQYIRVYNDLLAK